MKLRPLLSDPVMLAGGLDLVSIPAAIKPGRLISSINFEPSINGGYKKMRGIERYDGRSRPSDAVYYSVACSISGTVVVGNTITGATSSATAVVIVVNGSTELIVTKVVGTFVSETFNIGGSPQGTITSVRERSEESIVLDARYKNLAADRYRADITSVPGSGPIRGVGYLQGSVYALRDNAGGTACVLYKATASGWSAITFGKEVQFTSAVGQISEGQTVTGLTSGATGVVKRALLRTGTWTVSGVGTLVFDSVTGTFQNGEALQVAAVTKATSASASTTISLLPGGKFEIDVINFFGSAGQDRMYCADGVNILGEFDGTRWVPIRTGATTDTPKFVKSYRKHLVVGMGSSVMTSGTGSPYSWTALTGAAELATGETITGLMPEVGDASSGAMLVLTRNKAFMLYGNDVNDFNLVLHSPNSGGSAYTVQNLGLSHYLGQSGITQMLASQAFGNFQLSVLSSDIQPLIDEKRGMELSSCIVRESNQYRLFFNDGTGIIGRIAQGNSNAPIIGDYVVFDYGDRVMNVVCSVIDSAGAERIFGGCNNGYVYELNCGTSLDGDLMQFSLMTHFNHSKSLRTRKHYVRTVFQIKAEGYAEFNVGYDLGFGRTSISQSNLMAKTVNGTGGFWDSFTWDSFVWDSAFVPEVNIYTPGNGDSIALIFSGDSETTEPFTLHLCIPYFKVNRPER